MIVSIIVAAAKGGVIGREGGLPWYLPAELARFKEVTMGHPIIMGRKTHDSIGRALPGRQNIVITRDENYRAAEGATVAHSLEEALTLVADTDEAFIIGGEEIYKQAAPRSGRVYMTKVDADIEGDKFFNFDQENWRQVSSDKHQKDEKNKYDYDFTIWERR